MSVRDWDITGECVRSLVQLNLTFQHTTGCCDGYCHAAKGMSCWVI